MTRLLPTWRTVTGRPSPSGRLTNFPSINKEIFPPLFLKSCVPLRHSITVTLSPPCFVSSAAGSPPLSFPSSMADSNPNPVDPDCAEIIVIRHGETAWNADGRIQGHLDVDLNDVGRQQAASVAERVGKEYKISAVYASDLKRALETAEVIAASCGGVEVVKDQDLRERHLGDLQGLVLREAAKVSPKAYRAFLSHSTCQDIPGGGESLDQLYQRCTSALQRIASKHRGDRVVVVTHGGVIRTLYKRANPNERSGGKVLNTSVNIFHISDGDKWSIKTWGDISHLNQTGYLKSGFGGDQTSAMVHGSIKFGAVEPSRNATTMQCLIHHLLAAASSQTAR